MSCENRCVEPLDFPRAIHNRPALDRVAYRIGSYADFRAALLRGLDQSGPLADWTHREPDDPGIALLEGAAAVGDVLTLYQEVYANEVYLRTATWRESVSELVRLLGYRLAPGLGGRATVAFELRGERSVTVPGGFPVKADLETVGQADFETVEPLTAHPELGSFALHRRARFATISNGTERFSIPTTTVQERVGGLEPGDRLFLVDDATSADPLRQIVVVREVEERFDRTLVTIEGSWKRGSVATPSSGAPLTGFKLGRSFRRFGYNAPDTRVQVSGTSVTTVAVDTVLDLSGVTQIPLAAEVDDLAVGSTMLVQLDLRTSAIATSGVSRFFEREIRAARAGTATLAPMTGGATLVTLDAAVTLSGRTFASAREIELFEVLGRHLPFRGALEPHPGGDLGTLFFFGSSVSYGRLEKRSLMLARTDGVTETVVVRNDPSLTTFEGSRLRPVYLPALEQPFAVGDFPLFDPPAVTVHGNIVGCTQGKTEREAILGNGDSRREFQSFKLPHAPLTYLNSVGETPPHVPELAVYVEDRLWRRVPTLFGQSPDAEVYVVREDASGESWVQFGDGRTGRRLPSGLRNVRAVQRSGLGAHGPLREGATPKAGERLDGLRTVLMPTGATGGDEPERTDAAREAAPGRVQTLGRLVALADFESEALAIPGVSLARARWGLVENAPSVELTLLMETGRRAELVEAEHIVREYARCRGADRFPVAVVEGARRFVYAALEIGYDDTYRPELLGDDIARALGAAGAEEPERGLFALQNRRFGEREHASRIVGAAQNVPGVVWVEVVGFDALGPSDEPDSIPLPTTLVPRLALPAHPHGIYALRRAHLRLTFHVVSSDEAC